MTTGSSPLARGLHQDRRPGRRLLGIIPARAGFTSTTTSCPASSRDHPRSRGVYEGTTSTKTVPAGSSPLARGLPAGDAQDDGAAGIIPARAGFTTICTWLQDLFQDHPRSRGVYVRDQLRTEEARGSSPLARGLRRRRRNIIPRDGIIPARAGFTYEVCLLSVCCEDHPRSRGVYLLGQLGERISGGSSPLARGLPPASSSKLPHEGIIPARAGFTARAVTSNVTSMDHPRSRGVYSAFDPVDNPGDGSSPLARGLPTRSAAATGGGGIIPARAGFTVCAAWAARGGQDHPRSRGVYRNIP